MREEQREFLRSVLNNNNKDEIEFEINKFSFRLGHREMLKKSKEECNEMINALILVAEILGYDVIKNGETEYMDVKFNLYNITKSL